MAKLHKGAGNKLWMLVFLAIGLQCCTASQDTLPHPCDAVKCPPLSEITCPEDSSIRSELNALSPLHQDSSTTAAALIESYNTSEIADDDYLECCVTKKCICNTCYRPDCHREGEVVVELVPESMDTPGHCCGEYVCQREPNCTVEIDTQHYWLKSCQRCRCRLGEPFCHQECDEGVIGKKTNAMCNSKSLNKLFEHGDSWRDGCYDCECVNGDESCELPFCKSVNCPLDRQVMLKNACCPVCWPEGFPMPDEKSSHRSEGGRPQEPHYDDNDDEDDLGSSVPHDMHDMEEEPLALLPQPVDDSDDFSENEVDATPNTKLLEEVPSSTAASATTSNNNLTTGVIGTVVLVPTTAAPMPGNGCVMAGQNIQEKSAAANYQTNPEVVKVVRQMHTNDVLYIVIASLVLVALGLVAWVFHLRDKLRTYTLLPPADTNFNKIKLKQNEYA